MPNDIPAKQNTPKFIDRIAASSRAYAIVKNSASLQSMLLLSAAILGPVLTTIDPHWKVWGAFYAIGIWLVDLIFLEPRTKQYQLLGARIQELFDTDLLEIPWNSFRADEKPDPEVIAGLAKKFKKKESTGRLENWYPKNVDSVPLEFGRLICQRANMRWDSALRRRYASTFVITIFVLLIAGLGYSIYMGWKVDEIVLSVMVPLLPSGIKVFRERRKHVEAADTSDRAKSILQSAWNLALEQNVPNEQLLDASRRLQDELFDRRRSAPTVPQWMYRFFRPDFEDEMMAGASQMVEEVKKKLAETGDGAP